MAGREQVLLQGAVTTSLHSDHPGEPGGGPVPRPSSQAQSDAGLCLLKSSQMTLKWWSGWGRGQALSLLGQGLNQAAR